MTKYRPKQLVRCKATDEVFSISNGAPIETATGRDYVLLGVQRTCMKTVTEETLDKKYELVEEE